MYTLFIVIFTGIIIAVALVTPMRLQFTHFVHRNPHVCAVIGAFAVYLVLTGPVHFTFMADDWRHLAAAEQLSDLYADRFSRWVPRVPVWSIFAWIIFYFHIFERSWAPMYLVYAAHASAVALIARWLLRELDDKQDILSTNAWITAFAIGVGALYPNVYEILYWPTCMPYAVGGLFVAAALYARTRIACVTFAALAFLTYETFLLPALGLMVLPVLLNRSPAEPRVRIRAAVQLTLSWLSAALVMLSVRGVAALFLGNFYQKVNTNPSHVLAQAHASAQELFQIRFFGSGRNEIATWVMLGILVISTALLCQRTSWRWRPVILLVGCFLSTAVYWVLDYDAMRAIYGAQIMFSAVMVWLIVQASRAGVRPIVVSIGLSALGVVFVMQSASIMRIKDHNAGVLAMREASLAKKIQACDSECVVQYEDLDSGLTQDWVLHPAYWNSYLEWLHQKYGRDKHVEFVHKSEASN